jgi:hypothetical protein
MKFPLYMRESANLFFFAGFVNGKNDPRLGSLGVKLFDALDNVQISWYAEILLSPRIKP